MEDRIFNLREEVDSIKADIDNIMETVKSQADVQSVDDLKSVVNKLYKKVSLIEKSDAAKSDDILALSEEVKDLKLVITGLKLDFDKIIGELKYVSINVNDMGNKVERIVIILMIVVGGSLGVDKIMDFF